MSAYCGPATVEIEPDDGAMLRFLGWWFAKCNRGMVELGWRNSDGAITLFRRFDLADLDEAVAFACETNARPGNDMYFRAATVRGDVQFTHDADIMQIPGFWGDCDDEQATERLSAFAGLPGGAFVLTGRTTTSARTRLLATRRAASRG